MGEDEDEAEDDDDDELRFASCFGTLSFLTTASEVTCAGHVSRSRARQLFRYSFLTTASSGSTVRIVGSAAESITKMTCQMRMDEGARDVMRTDDGGVGRASRDLSTDRE